MNKEELAKILDGRQYRYEITKDEEQIAKDNGLVVVFGASDDLVEFRGAINEEFDCYDGGTIYFDKNGAIQNPCNDDDCPYHQKKLEEATQILAVWGNDAPALGVQGYSWSFRAVDLPNHATFDILEDKDKFCRGFIFDINDVK